MLKISNCSNSNLLKLLINPEEQLSDLTLLKNKLSPYLKHRYQKFNYRIGTLTEYFKFNDVELVLDDLQQMKPKALTSVELELIDKNWVEQLVTLSLA
jgi:hypothetical protein